MSVSTAERLHLAVGIPGVLRNTGADRLSEKTDFPLTVVALLDPQDEALKAGLEDVVVMDIAWAQQLLKRDGKLSAIELRLEADQLERLRGALPTSTALINLEQEGLLSSSLGQLACSGGRAFGWLALAVGLSLIANTFTFLNVQRRITVSSLRLLGVTPSSLLAVALLEARGLGLLGSMLGVLLGTGGAYGLVTIATAEGIERIRPSLPTMLQVGQWLGLGCGASLLACWGAAREVSQTPPLIHRATSLLQTSQERVWRFRGAVAIVLATAMGLWATTVPPQSRIAPLVLATVALSLVAPWLVKAALLGLRPLVLSLPAQLVWSSLASATGRVAAALVALVLALTFQLGLSLSVGRMERAAIQWVEAVLQADIVVRTMEPVWARGQGALPSQVLDQAKGLSGVEEVDRHRATSVLTSWGEVNLAAVCFGPRMRRAFVLLDSDPAAWSSFASGQGVFVSESLAFHQGLKVGQKISLLAPDGAQEFPIVAVYRDFSSGAGNLAMEGETYARLWKDPLITSLWLFLSPGTSLASAADHLSLTLGQQPVAVVRQSVLRHRSLQAIRHATGVLYTSVWVAMVVAGLSAFQACLAVSLERRRYYGVLGSLGMRPLSRAGLVLMESGLLGFSAALTALPLGLWLADSLSSVLGQSVGWVFPEPLPLLPILSCLALGSAAGLAGGVVPALMVSRMNLAEALRWE